MSECRAFNLTVSCKGDIADEAVKDVVKYVRKTALWYHVVVESETSKRHLHASLFYKEPKDKKKLRDNIWNRYVKPHHPTSIGRACCHLQVCPGRKWVDQYLQKEETVDIVASCLPPPDSDEPLETFFPSKELQEQLMAAKEKVVDVFYSVHEVEYKEWLHENSWVSATATAHEYFKMRMFVRKDMRVIADSRRVHQMACALHAYATDSYKLTALETQTHLKESGEYDFRAP